MGSQLAPQQNKWRCHQAAIETQHQQSLLQCRLAGQRFEQPLQQRRQHKGHHQLAQHHEPASDQQGHLRQGEGWPYQGGGRGCLAAPAQPQLAQQQG